VASLVDALSPTKPTVMIPTVAHSTAVGNAPRRVFFFVAMMVPPRFVFDRSPIVLPAHSGVCGQGYTAAVKLPTVDQATKTARSDAGITEVHAWPRGRRTPLRIRCVESAHRGVDLIVGSARRGEEGQADRPGHHTRGITLDGEVTLDRAQLGGTEEV
jgi:hypothetical protein